jgi:hypothetical protein
MSPHFIHLRAPIWMQERRVTAGMLSLRVRTGNHPVWHPLFTGIQPGPSRPGRSKLPENPFSEIFAETCFGVRRSNSSESPTTELETGKPEAINLSLAQVSGRDLTWPR